MVPATNFSIECVQRHENFTARHPAHDTAGKVTQWEDNDIAVITLSDPILPADEVGSVCLKVEGTDSFAEDQTMTVSGWGSGAGDNELKKLEVKYSLDRG